MSSSKIKQDTSSKILLQIKQIFKTDCLSQSWIAPDTYQTNSQLLFRKSFPDFKKLLCKTQEAISEIVIHENTPIKKHIGGKGHPLTFLGCLGVGGRGARDHFSWGQLYMTAVPVSSPLLTYFAQPSTGRYSIKKKININFFLLHDNYHSLDNYSTILCKSLNLTTSYTQHIKTKLNT